jgi:ornithine decarboxylase
MSVHKAPQNNFSIVSCLDWKVQTVQRELGDDVGFWIADMNRPRESLSLWTDNLPSVKLFYAIKCCDEPNLLRFLADSGCGFDCASQDELARILALGVESDRIVFSHPIKNRAALRYAKEEGVDRLVFDTVEELDKIMEVYPGADVFLRIKPKFSNALIQLSNKFGAEPQDIAAILKHVKDVGANFIGFSFHVGSLCDDITTFRTALQYVSELKSDAELLGLKVSFIDIGGGFLPPNAPANHQFASIAAAIENSIEEFFGGDEVEFIGEPGRFISSEYMDLHLPVICAKQHVEKDEISQSIYIPDGMYGSFNALSYDHAMPHFEMFGRIDDNKRVPTTLWGQTCDSADCIYEGMDWPMLRVGDMLTVRKFSAYTYSPTSFFNGFNHHKVFVVNREDDGE